MYSSALSPYLVSGIDELLMCKSELEQGNIHSAIEHAEIARNNLRNSASDEILSNLDVLIQLLNQNNIKDSITLIKELNKEISSQICLLEGTSVDKLRKENKS